MGVALVTGVGVAGRATFAVGAVRTERASFGRTVASTEDRLLVRDRSADPGGATVAGTDGASLGVLTWTAGELAAPRTGDAWFPCATRLSGVQLVLSRSRPARETASATATESRRVRTLPATRPIEPGRAGSTTGAATGGAAATDAGMSERERGWLELPAIVVVGFWFVFQYVAAFMEMETGVSDGIAYWDHLGGVFAGVARNVT